MKSFRFLSIFVCAVLFCSASIHAQVKLTKDTLDSPYFGFHFSTLFPSDDLSTENGMHDLYESPFLRFGIDAGWKTKSNWLMTLEGGLTIGNDNLRNRAERMPAAFSTDAVPFVIGSNGIDANATCYNRGLDLRIGGGRIFTLGRNNPNSGIVTRLSAGIMQQKTIFVMNDATAPQLEGDYARLYDHKRRGFTLTESIGYWFMSNYSNLINFYVAFEVTQCWNHSVRDYVIDNVMGLSGPDDTKYFDLIYGIKICWMFPLKGKTAYDYYFY